MSGRARRKDDSHATAVPRAVCRRLARSWTLPTLAGVPITVNPRLKRTLGRVLRQPPAIQLSPVVLDLPRRTEVITHEAAHAALALAGKANTTRPHGPEWRRLMALAGFPDARATRSKACMPKPRPHTSTRYVHRCPVCQTTRTAKRRAQAVPRPHRPQDRRPDMNLVELDHALRKLRLSGMADVLETRLRQAQTDKQAPLDLVSALVSDELLRRQDRLFERRHKLARFRDPDRALDSFDFDFNKKMNRALV